MNAARGRTGNQYLISTVTYKTITNEFASICSRSHRPDWSTEPSSFTFRPHKREPSPVSFTFFAFVKSVQAGRFRLCLWRKMEDSGSNASSCFSEPFTPFIPHKGSHPDMKDCLACVFRSAVSYHTSFPPECPVRSCLPFCISRKHARLIQRPLDSFTPLRTCNKKEIVV